MCVHFEDIFPSQKKLRDLQSRTAGYHPGPRGIETLHPGIASHHNCFLRPQELDVFPRGQKTKLMTGAIVSLSIGTQRQIGSHCGNENNTVGYALQTAGLHSQRGHRQWGHHNATRRTIRESYGYGIARMNLELWKTWFRHHGSTEGSIGRRPYDHSKSTSRLDGRTHRRKTGPILSREELHPQGQRTTMGHS